MGAPLLSTLGLKIPVLNSASFLFLVSLGRNQRRDAMIRAERGLEAAARCSSGEGTVLTMSMNPPTAAFAALAAASARAAAACAWATGECMEGRGSTAWLLCSWGGSLTS